MVDFCLGSQYTSEAWSSLKSHCKIKFPADLVTFTKEICNGKPHFFIFQHTYFREYSIFPNGSIITEII